MVHEGSGLRRGNSHAFNHAFTLSFIYLHVLGFWLTTGQLRGSERTIPRVPCDGACLRPWTRSRTSASDSRLRWENSERERERERRIEWQLRSKGVGETMVGAFRVSLRAARNSRPPS